MENQLLPCPFCGGKPVVKKIGNEYMRKRTVQIRCPECRIERRDSTLKPGWDWVEAIAIKNWNQRPEAKVYKKHYHEFLKERYDKQ